jgi:hypothetical protein
VYTDRETGSNSGEFVAVEPVMVRVPVWIPSGNPVGSADTVSGVPVMPLSGDADIQGWEAVADHARHPSPLLDTNRVWALVLEPPISEP